MSLSTLTIARLREGLLQKEFSAVEITREYLEAIRARDPELHAYLAVSTESAIASASAVDISLSRGGVLPALAGVPFALKDNLLVEGERTTAGSKMLGEYVAAYDATAVRRLRESGAVFLGKTNLDEFAMGSSTENSAFGPTRNPHDPTLVPGGSSGGSAAAVAAGMALAALGSDTGGSIRQPAGFCGVVGFKPTYGRVSRFGLIAMASSLDQIGPFARTVHDAALVYRAIRGADPLDATSRDLPEATSPDRRSAGEVTIGLPREFFETEGVQPEVARAVEGAIETLRSLGLRFREVRLPHAPQALSVYYILMPAEVSTNLARLDGIRYAPVIPDVSPLLERYLVNRGEGFGRETKRRVVLGTFVLSAGYYDAYYAKAQKVRRIIAQEFDEVFRDVDLVLAPTSPTVPFALGEKVSDPLAMYLSDVFTIPANLAGLPALSLPVRGREGKLPVGFQLMAPRWHDEKVLEVGRWYEEAAEA